MVITAGAASSTPDVLRRRSEQKLSAAFNQGIARGGGRWVVTGRNIVALADDLLHVVRQLTPAIPREVLARGYNHVGDPDVVGSCIYAPLEQSNFDLGQQVTARYDLKSLRYVDSVTLPQHENSFVAIDPATGIAYTMDHFSGSALLRYDVAHAWTPLPPLTMSKYLYKVQGAAVGGGAVWLSTSDAGNPLYRVDLATGEVADLGSAGHDGGEGEGIAFARVGAATLHTMVVDPALTPVWLGHYSLASNQWPTRPSKSSGAARSVGSCSTDRKPATR